MKKLFNSAKKEKKPLTTKQEIEYLILYFISGYAAIRGIAAYQNAKDNAMLYMYANVVSWLVWLIANAKLSEKNPNQPFFFNIFRLIRKIPFKIKSIWKILITDYTNWKNKTGYYEQK